jgi:chitosanase
MTRNVALPRTLLLLVLGLLAVAPAAAPAAAHAQAPVLTPAQRHVADQLVSVFENDTTRIRYDYVVDLHDGCGITAGRAGFCSATGDMLMVVRDYTARRPHNGLTRYLRVLRARAADGSASDRGLRGAFRTAWRRAARDARFRAAQDQVVDDLYFDPAARLAGATGLTSPLAVAIFYDTAIEHGTSEDPDGLPALIARTVTAAGGAPAAVGEARWLAAFLDVRRADLLDPHNRARRVDWPESVGRTSALRHLLLTGALDLAPPLAVNPWGDRTFTLR